MREGWRRDRDKNKMREDEKRVGVRGAEGAIVQSESDQPPKNRTRRLDALKASLPSRESSKKKPVIQRSVQAPLILHRTPNRPKEPSRLRDNLRRTSHQPLLMMLFLEDKRLVLRWRDTPLRTSHTLRRSGRSYSRR